MDETMKRILAVILAGLALNAQAGLFTDDEAHQKIAELRAQAQKMDERLVQAEAASKQSIVLLNQIEKMREDMAALQGKIEVLQFNLDEAVKRQKDLYLDLDTRVRNIELAKQQSAQAEEKARSEQKAVEQKQLDAAIQLVRSGKNKEGVAALAKYLKENPKTPRRAEAVYWMGAGYAAQKNYKAANQAFAVAAKSVDDPRAPDALLGLASIAVAQKDKKKARRYLVQIVEKYPQSEAAATAKKALTAN